ncbi:MAG: hypothetical protein CUN49_01130 [Candidatus Thermofonsia Clade 1 bacterium]|jgi:glycerol dehydrogenase-like iron-containing ADH family enzyme|uniref:Iron-containing alcohol dehydrogenase n=1 Tax=Candidatus Thermofonsia Clade 1 bacterium TaxID=2364210 RepID=A0A2M8PIB7_9CHLR|nr:MAG: hypothetical protein CUN49_01130 [Candidatus Thermofonsia Clade 1 bacterium]RMF52059.1 MAG: iron-containing alcohol dehydrogenase [Chloroflexota bacterium]
MNVLALPALRLTALRDVQEKRLTALIASDSAWSALRGTLQLPLLTQAHPIENSREFFEYLAAKFPTDAEIIYAVGADETVLNAAKYVAQRVKRPLVIVPEALSSAECLTPYIHLNTERLVTGAASEVILDVALLNQNLPIGAIVDVLSIITALMDWNYAHQHNRTAPEAPYRPWVASLMAGFAAQALKIAEGIGKGEPEATNHLLELLCLTVQMDNLLGHQCGSHGTEHLFALALAQQPEGAAISYADRVACGILIASALHKKDVAPLRKALESAGLHPTAVPSPLARAALNALPDLAKKHQAPYSIAHDLQPNSEALETALQRAGLS